MIKDKNIKDRYIKLIEIINKHNLLYHTYDSPKISDDQFDDLYNELKEIEKNFPSMILNISPSQRVGSELLESFEKREHERPMLSLSNAATQDDFIDFYNKLKENQSNSSVDLFAEPKFDGLAVNITYENGVYLNATTRGDGYIGEDVTNNVKTVKSLPISIDATSLPRKFSIRGEIFIDKNDFNMINEELRKNGQKQYSNPRNLASGSIRQLDPSIANSRRLRLFIHGVSDPEIFKNYRCHSDLFSFFNKLGFPVNKYSRVINNIDDCLSYFEEMNNLRNNIPYEIDGLVYRVNDFQYYKSLGFTSKSPKWAIAYKFKSQESLSQIQDVTFQVGRTGTITPVAELTPVKIGGVRVARATLHNFSEINTKDIRINDYVYVKRAGDVIPDIDRVELTKRESTRKIKPPKKCPSCGSLLEKIDDQVAYRCTNHKNCVPQIEQSIIHFISRKAMNIQGIGNQLIKELVSKKIISRSADLYTLTGKDFKKLDRVGDKSINNYLSSIQASKKITFSKFIYALGIREVGESSSRALASEFKSIDELIKCQYEHLVEIHDIGPIVAKNILSYFKDKYYKSNVENLISSGIDLIYQSKSATKQLSIVITGSFDEYKRSDLSDIFEANGYKISNTLSKNTNILICGEKPGTKLKKAQSYGTKIIYKDELVKLLSEFH